MLVKFVIPVALAAGVLISAGCRGGFHGGGGRAPFALLESRMKLEADQKSALREVFKRHKPALATHMETLAQARNAAMDAGMDPAVAPEAWRAQQERVAEAAYAMAKEVRGAYLEALPILSEAQKAEGRALLSKARAHRGGRHGRHHELAFRFVKNRLDLTEAQSTAIRTTLEHHGTAFTAKRDAFHGALAAILEAGLDPATPQAALDQRFTVAKEAGIALSTEMRSAYLEIHPQLTPEQQEGARALVKDFRTAVDAVRKLVLGF